MNIKCKGTAFLFFLCISYGNTQSFSNRFFSSGTEIVIDVLPGNDIAFSHPLDKGITIYNLAKVFHADPDKVYKLNKLTPGKPVNEGRIVKIPLSKEFIVSGHELLKSKLSGRPVYYVVKKGESMYRISREYTGIDISQLVKMNKKQTEDIHEGEKLLVGFLIIDKDVKIPVISRKMTDKEVKDKETLQPLTKIKYLQKESSEQEASPEKSPVVKFYNSNVIAMWDKKSDDSSGLFVLHDEARPGSTLDIYSPMLKKHVKAKVIGKIPEGTYTEDINLLLSPSVARELGLLDTRCMVNIKFEK